MSCGQAHSQAREFVAQGKEAKLVAETLEISRSSLYYRRNREPVMPIARTISASYRLRREAGLRLSSRGLVAEGITGWCQRQARVARHARAWPAGPQRRFRISRRKDWSKVEASHPNLVWQSDMTKVWAGPTMGWAYLVSVIDCCTREIVGWDLSLRCRTEEALRRSTGHAPGFAFRSSWKGLTLTTDNGTQFTSARYVETLSQLGITHRRTAYNHPEGNGYIERFHRSLKEEEVWLNEYQTSIAKRTIARWIQQYNHDRPHRGLHGRTPHDARARFVLTLTSNMAPSV